MTTRRRLEVLHSVSTVILVCLALQAFPSTPLVQAHSQRSASSARMHRGINATSGFYFEVSPCPRCHRCRPCTLNAGWQKRVMRLLHVSGIESFPGESSGLESATEAFGTVGVIKRFATPRDYNTMVYVGPFDSADAAKAAIPQLCAVLGEIGEMESSCDEMVAKREGNTFYTRGSFDVSGLRVLPKPTSKSHSTGRSDTISFMLEWWRQVGCHSPRAGQFHRSMSSVTARVSA